jgi:organic radical activating enzyme
MAPDITIEHMRISVSYQCNLRCEHCYVPEDFRMRYREILGDKELSLDQIRGFIDFLIDNHGLEKVSVTGGETLIKSVWQRTHAVLAHANRRRLRVQLNTGGLGQIPMPDIVGIFDDPARLMVQISLDGSSAATVDRFRGRRGVFDSALRAAADLQDAAGLRQAQAIEDPPVPPVQVGPEPIVEADSRVQIVRRPVLVATEVGRIVDASHGYALREQPTDRLLNGDRCLVRVRRLADGTADHDVVGAAAQGLLDGDDPLLIVDRAVVDRTDAGGHDEELLAQALTQGPGFETGRDHSVTAELQGAAGPREDQPLDVDVEAQIIEVAPVEAGEDGDRQDLQVALFAAGGLEDAVVAVDGDEGERPLPQVAHRRPDRFRDVEELEIGENLLAAGG